MGCGPLAWRVVGLAKSDRLDVGQGGRRVHAPLASSVPGGVGGGLVRVGAEGSLGGRGVLGRVRPFAFAVDLRGGWGSLGFLARGYWTEGVARIGWEHRLVGSRSGGVQREGGEQW